MAWLAPAALAAGLLVACLPSEGDEGIEVTAGSALAYQDDGALLMFADLRTRESQRAQTSCMSPWSANDGSPALASWTSAKGGLFACVGPNGELIVQNPSLGAVVEALPDGGCGRDVRFSATGEFVSCMLESRLRVRRTDGGFVSEVSGVAQYSWSGAGDYLVIRRAEPPARSYLLTPEGTAIATLSGLADVGMVRWSPDGRRLAFASGELLVVVDAQLGSISELPLPWSESELLGWSASGEEVLLVPIGTGRSAIWAVNAGTGKGDEVLSMPDIWGATASADGRWVVFATSSVSGDDVVLADLTDRSIRRLGEHPLPARREGKPAFRFDRSGEHVCWVSVETVTCDSTTDMSGVSHPRRPGDSEAVALARTSCTGEFVLQLSDTASEFFVLNPQGETVFTDGVLAESEPIWLC